jgi:hypothetical protein
MINSISLAYSQERNPEIASQKYPLKVHAPVKPWRESQMARTRCDIFVNEPCYGGTSDVPSSEISERG